MKISPLICLLIGGLTFQFLHSQITPAKIKKIITKVYKLEPTQEPSGKDELIFDENGNEIESIRYDEHGRITHKSTNIYDSIGRKIEYIWFWQFFIPHDYGGSTEEVHHYYFYDQLGKLKYDSSYSTHNGLPNDYSSKVVYGASSKYDDPNYLIYNLFDNYDTMTNKYNEKHDLVEQVLNQNDTLRYEYKYDLRGNKTKTSYFLCNKGKKELSGTEWYFYDRKGDLEKDSSASFYTDTMTVCWVRTFDNHGSYIKEVGYTYSTGQRHPIHRRTHRYLYDKEENWIEWETVDEFQKTREVTKRSIEYY